MNAPQLPGPSTLAYTSAAIAGGALIAAAVTSGPLSLGLGLTAAVVGVAGPLAALRIDRTRARLPRNECPPCGRGDVLEGEPTATLEYADLPSRRWRDSIQRDLETAASQPQHWL